MKQKKKRGKLKWIVIIIVVLIVIVMVIGASGDSESGQSEPEKTSSVEEEETLNNTVSDETETSISTNEEETSVVDSDNGDVSPDEPEQTPKDYIFSGDDDNYPIYVYTKGTELVTISKYVFMGETLPDTVDINFNSSVGDDSGNMELEVRRPEFGDDEYSLWTHDWDYKDLNEPIIIDFASDMSYIDVSATWNENVTNEQSLYNGHYELEGIYTVEEYARKFYSGEDFVFPNE